MSQFIEMFGIAEATKPLADFIEVSFPGEWGQEDKDGSGVKVIRTTNFTNNGKLDLSDVVTRDIDSAKIEKKKLFKGDIILERSGGTNDNPVGRVVYFEEDGVYLFNNFTQLLRCKEGVNSLFIFYSLFNYYQMNKNVIRSMGNKTTGIQNLKMDKYWQIPIADVSIELQKEFESIYRQADKSGFDGRKSQFIELFFKNTWKEQYLEDVVSEDCSLSYGIVQPGEGVEDGIPVVRPVDLVSDIVEPDCLKKTTIDIANSYKRTTLKGGELLLCVRGTTGLLSMASNRLNGGNVTRGIVPIWFKKDISKAFMFHQMKSDYVQTQIKENTYGTTLLQINIKDLRKIKVILPPEDLQLKFVSVAEQADKSGSVLQHMIAC